MTQHYEIVVHCRIKPRYVACVMQIAKGELWSKIAFLVGLKSLGFFKLLNLKNTRICTQNDTRSLTTWFLFYKYRKFKILFKWILVFLWRYFKKQLKNDSDIMLQAKRKVLVKFFRKVLVKFFVIGRNYMLSCHIGWVLLCIKSCFRENVDNFIYWCKYSRPTHWSKTSCKTTDLIHTSPRHLLWVQEVYLAWRRQNFCWCLS